MSKYSISVTFIPRAEVVTTSQECGINKGSGRMLRLLRLSLGYKAVLVQAWKGFHDIVSDWLELKL